jgi:hypothetical protein
MELEEREIIQRALNNNNFKIMQAGDLSKFLTEIDQQLTIKRKTNRFVIENKWF